VVAVPDMDTGARLTLIIEGPQAVMAVDRLLAMPGLVGSYEPVGTDAKDGTLGVIADIVTIFGGGLAAAELLRQWYLEGKAGPERTLEKVVIEVQGVRLLLEGATIADITKLLEPLARSRAEDGRDD
jgi:hypothetical protein